VLECGETEGSAASNVPEMLSSDVAEHMSQNVGSV
jgi:hypothetical protein